MLAVTSTATGVDHRHHGARNSGDMWHDLFLRKMLLLSFLEVPSGTGCHACDAQSSSENGSTTRSAGAQEGSSSGLAARLSGLRLALAHGPVLADAPPGAPKGPR